MVEENIYREDRDNQKDVFKDILVSMNDGSTIKTS